MKALWGGHTAALQFMLSAICDRAHNRRMAKESREGKNRRPEWGRRRGRATRFQKKMTKAWPTYELSCKMHAVEDIILSGVCQERAISSLEAKNARESSQRLFLKRAWSEQRANRRSSGATRTSNGATRASKSENKCSYEVHLGVVGFAGM